MDHLYEIVATVTRKCIGGSRTERRDERYDRALRQLRRSVMMLSPGDPGKGDFCKNVLRACDEVVKLDEAELPQELVTQYLQLRHVAHRLDCASCPEDLVTCAQWIVEMSETLEKDHCSATKAIDPAPAKAE